MCFSQSERFMVAEHTGVDVFSRFSLADGLNVKTWNARLHMYDGRTSGVTAFVLMKSRYAA